MNLLLDTAPPDGTLKPLPTGIQQVALSSHALWQVNSRLTESKGQTSSPKNQRKSPSESANYTGANTSTYNDILADFRAAMAAGGVDTDDAVIADSTLHRVHINGHRRGTRNGAYILHGDGRAAGWFKDYKSGATGTWAAGGKFLMDDETRRQIEEAQAKRKAEQWTRTEAAARSAQAIWDQSVPCTEHSYLHRKGVTAHGLRRGSWSKWTGGPGNWTPITIDDALLVPMRDASGVIWNIQAIFPELHTELGRDKDFLGGARKTGLFHVIGDHTPTVMVSEGYATGATVHAFTGNQTYIAFDAGNLKPVALTIRDRHPNVGIVIAGDNDHKTPGNPGLSKAREAALAVGGRLMIPTFTEDEVGSDWNDWAKNRRFSGSPRNMNLIISQLGSFAGKKVHHDGV